MASRGRRGWPEDTAGSPPASADLRRAMGLLHRMTGYLDEQEHQGR